MKSITFRKANLSDIYAIMDIERDSFHFNIVEKEEVFRSRIETYNDGFYVAILTNKIIGYVSSELWEYVESYNHDRFLLDHNINKYHNTSGRELYISSLGLLNQYRGQGYGSRLFNYIIDIHKDKIDSTILLVSHEFKKAKLMYEKQGFKIVDTVYNAFIYSENDAQEGLIMRKNYKEAV